MALKRTTKSKVTSVISKKVRPLPKKPKVYPFYTYPDENEEYSNISDVINDDMGSGESFDVTKHLSSLLTVDFSFTTDASQHTCGFIEVGELSTNARTDYPSSINALSGLLDDIVTCSKGYTLFMNTNESKCCKAIAAAAAKSAYWVKVKTYLNPGSKNMLTLWVTNN